MPPAEPAPITASVEVAAPPSTVWEQIADPRSMARFSPELRLVVPLHRTRRGLGTSFLGINRRGLVVWPTTSRIVRYEPEQALAWRVRESGATWSYELEPSEQGGTRLSATRELPRYGPLTRVFGPVVGGARGHDVDLADGLRHTLERIKAAAEAA